MSAPFRIAPNMPASAYKTYTIAKPHDTFVKAACQEVGCVAYAHGWETLIDESTDLGRSQGDYIRRQSGRTFTEICEIGGMTVFRFEPFQRCFADHQTRPETYGIYHGDWRGTFGQLRTHTRPADWVEDFATHQQGLADLIEKG